MSSQNTDLSLPLCYLSAAAVGRPRPRRRRLQPSWPHQPAHDGLGETNDAASDECRRPRQRPRHGAAGWLVLSIAAVLPILWAFTLAMHFARPYVIRFLQSLTLRFGGDVWWLCYVLIRDALLVVTLALSLIFLFPNLYMKGEGLPITAPIATLVLFWVLIVKLTRDTDDDPATFRIVSVLLVIASVLYIVPQVYGIESADQEYLGDLPSKLISVSNIDIAKPILWGSIALFALTGLFVIVRFVLSLGRRGDAAAPEAAGGSVQA